MPASKTKVTVLMTVSKETKGTKLFEEVRHDGNGNIDGPALRQMYVQRSTLRALGDPLSINVTLEAAE